MRFCSMVRGTAVRISSGHLENEIHFQQAAPGPDQCAGIQSEIPHEHPGRDQHHPRRAGRRFPASLLWLLLAIVVILAGVVGYAYYVAHSALPQLDGRLQINGLSAPVTVTRDSHGVPTIEAANLRRSFLRTGLRHGAGPAVADGRDAPLWQRRTLGDSGRGHAQAGPRTANSGPAGSSQESRWRWRARAIAASSRPTRAE